MPSDSPEPDSAATDDQAMLVTWLSTHDAPCPACKYNLRHLTEPRCPECGRPLSLAVTVIEPYLRSWVALIVLLCLNAGPGIFLWIGLTRELIKHGTPDLPPQWWYRGLIAFYVAAPPLAIAALFLRRRFVKLPRITQNYIVTVISAVTLAAFVTILYEMFL